MADDGYDSPLTDLEDSTSSSSGYSSPEETFSESSGSEYGGETYKQQPAKKRVRAAKAPVTRVASAAKGSGRKKKTLDLIVTMPIDILLEIFSLLDPADLLFLSRTTKAFRKVLLSKNANSVWKAARVNRGNVPDCMPGMSEVKWANLLFGGSQCCVCGTKGIMRIDFGIGRRACTSCLKKNLVYKPNFPSKFPDFDPVIMDLIPFTNIGGWAHGNASGSKFFWSDDVLRMAVQLGVYQKGVHMFKPGAKKALEDFKQSRKEFVNSVVHHTAFCNAWADRDRNRHLSSAIDIRSQNKVLIKARLVHLGHDAEDVRRMFDDRDYRNHGGCKELTDARWKRLLPRIERSLAESKEKCRLDDQRYASSRRKACLLDMYDGYVRLRRAIAPPSKGFLELCDVADFINSPPTVEQGNDTEACRAFADKIPELCAGYIHETKLALTQLLGTSTDVLQDTLTLQNQGADVPDETSLQLATSIFRCTLSHLVPLITWDSVQNHKCYSFGYRTASCTFSISQPGIAAARSLLSLVGLDAKTTTATTMDQLQCHFFCSNCPPKPENGGSYRMAMDWRRSVIHHVEQSHAEPRWELLSAAQLKDIKHPEYPRASDRVWCCNKCDRHRENPVNKANVIDHVRWHGITTPNQGVDFSYDQASVGLPPPGTKFFVTPPQTRPAYDHNKLSKNKKNPQPGQQYRCQPCNRPRTFLLHGIQQHLQAKYKMHSIKSYPIHRIVFRHKISSPVEGEHFSKVN
ncbi:hypothetical protein DEU56DRAFT_911980 [Suillus clintonianus]|uniref:uncharacterized protein n=1 Tax=Suillus clintonianus TaxID=1904413 RepID=UPI001B86234E|nr:uncharacterized protein DEU56DRAFT_911980 [Suillus clintonianus]KAG2139716.1 hypothetical protein DEU56DRAFT_911980 [Suillus clintonianus]